MIQSETGKAAQAILWECVRLNRRELLMKFASALALCLLMWSISEFGNKRLPISVAGGAVLVVCAVSALSSELWLNRLTPTQAGFRLEWHFVKPISTWLLVAVPFLVALLSSLSSFLIPVAFFRWLSRSEMPLLGPAMEIVAIVACLSAAAWSPRAFWGRVVSVGAVGVTTILFFVINNHGLDEPLIIAMMQPEYFNLAWYHYASLVAAAISAYGLTCLAVDRQRSGEALLAWKHGRLPIATDTPKRPHGFPSNVAPAHRFRSRFAAQFWYEFRHAATRILGLAAMVPAVLVIVVVAMSASGVEQSTMDRTWMLTLVIAPIVYQLLGIDGAVGLRNERGVLRMWPFDALRPLDSSDLVGIKLLVIFACSTAGWCLLMITFAAYTFFSGEAEHWLTVGGRLGRELARAPLSAVAMGIAGVLLNLLGSSATLLAVWLWGPRHRKLSATLSAAAVGHCLLIAWDASRGWKLYPLWVVYSYALPAIAITLSPDIAYAVGLAPIARKP